MSKRFNDAWRGYTHVKYSVVSKSGGDVQANDVVLPNVGNKNYVEYGLGVEKSLLNDWNFTTEVNRRDGGREDWNVQVNLKFDF